MNQKTMIVGEQKIDTTPIRPLRVDVQCPTQFFQGFQRFLIISNKIKK